MTRPNNTLASIQLNNPGIDEPRRAASISPPVFISRLDKKNCNGRRVITPSVYDAEVEDPFLETDAIPIVPLARVYHRVSQNLSRSPGRDSAISGVALI